MEQIHITNFKKSQRTWIEMNWFAHFLAQIKLGIADFICCSNHVFWLACFSLKLSSQVVQHLPKLCVANFNLWQLALAITWLEPHPWILHKCQTLTKTMDMRAPKSFNSNHFYPLFLSETSSALSLVESNKSPSVRCFKTKIRVISYFIGLLSYLWEIFVACLFFFFFLKSASKMVP